MSQENTIFTIHILGLQCWQKLYCSTSSSNMCPPPVTPIFLNIKFLDAKGYARSSPSFFWDSRMGKTIIRFASETMCISHIEFCRPGFIWASRQCIPWSADCSSNLPPSYRQWRTNKYFVLLSPQDEEWYWKRNKPKTTGKFILNVYTSVFVNQAIKSNENGTGRGIVLINVYVCGYRKKKHRSTQKPKAY